MAETDDVHAMEKKMSKTDVPITSSLATEVK
jgi:hypothetical protein